MHEIDKIQKKIKYNTTSLDKSTSSQTSIDLQVKNILNNAKQLRGYTVNDLIDHLNIEYKPHENNLVHAKGITGQIIEILLGATAKSKPLPDFPELNLEIKTLPIDLQGSPLETTYVCTAPLLPKYKQTKDNLCSDTFVFKNSVVYKKLSKVLWIPIIVTDNQRIIGNAFIWQPNHIELKLLEHDWLELTEMMYLGDIEKVTSHFGEVLQIRPKAANSSIVSTGINADGDKIKTLPRGFYLRKQLTKEIYAKNNLGLDILP